MRRRLIVIACILLLIPCLVLLFVVMFKPHDDLRLLRPFVRSEYVEYYEIKQQPGVLWRTRQLTLYGQPRGTAYSDATTALQTIYSGKPGWMFDPTMNTWLTSTGGYASIFGRLDIDRWQGHPVKPFPEDREVPSDFPFYFSETAAVTDWREKVWARATGRIEKQTVDPSLPSNLGRPIYEQPVPTIKKP